MIALAYVPVGIALWLGAMVCFVVFGYHFFMTVDNKRPDRVIAFYLLLPFSLCMSAFLTEDGCYHRNRMGIWLLGFAICGGLFAIWVSIAHQVLQAGE
jgi:hypothetical protein